MNKKIVAIVIAVVLLVGGGAGAYYLTQSNNNKSTDNSKTQDTTKNNTATWNNNELTFSGQNGKTALELSQAAATIVTSGTGEMAYVTSINGVAANPANQYWQLNVNGESASVGAGSLITKDDDTITWKLSSF